MIFMAADDDAVLGLCREIVIGPDDSTLFNKNKIKLYWKLQKHHVLLFYGLANFMQPLLYETH